MHEKSAALGSVSLPIEELTGLALPLTLCFYPIRTDMQKCTK